jgi:hypothetical protein
MMYTTRGGSKTAELTFDTLLVASSETSVGTLVLGSRDASRTDRADNVYDWGRRRGSSLPDGHSFSLFGSHGGCGGIALRLVYVCTWCGY